MNERKIIFKVYNAPISGKMLRINSNIRASLNTLIRATGLPASKIVEQVLEYAVNNFEVEEVE